MITLVVPGEPVPLPRQRMSFRNGVVRSYQASGPIKAYKAAIGVMCRQVLRKPSTESVVVEIEFLFREPKRKTRPYPCTCDIDNCIKAVLDALNGVAWEDDRQVTDIMASKRYGDPSTIIRMWGV